MVSEANENKTSKNVAKNKKEKANHLNIRWLALFFVRLTGLEPAHRKTLDPKSSASTNFATGAKNECKGTKKS